MEAERDLWRSDCGILLDQLDHLEECTGEGPDGEDLILVEGISAALANGNDAAKREAALAELHDEERRLGLE